MPKNAKIPAVRFNLKSHDPKDKAIDTLIILVFRYNGKKMVYSTGEKVKPKYWDKSTRRAKYSINQRGYADLNQRLNRLEELTIEIFKEHDFGNIEISTFKKELAYRNGDQHRPEDETDRIPSVMEFIDNYVKQRAENINAKRGTWKKFLTAYNHLKEYANDKGKTLEYDSFDWEFKNGFENWLYSSPRNHSINYASKLFQVIKQFLFEAKRRGYNTSNIFEQKGWSIGKVKIKKIALTFDELKKLSDLDLDNNKRLDKVRDLFLIGAYSGLRFSDFTRIKPEHIVKEEGIEMIELFTQKTDTEVAIPLMPVLKQILEKYGYESPKAISSQKMNDYLKELCQLAGINDKLIQKYSASGRVKEKEVEKWQLITTHTARRSFATNFYELGIPASQLMMITGHSTEKQFMAYINIGKRRNAKNIAKQFALLMNQSHLKVVK